jgi:hypothetical protein
MNQLGAIVIAPLPRSVKNNQQRIRYFRTEVFRQKYPVREGIFLVFKNFSIVILTISRAKE